MSEEKIQNEAVENLEQQLEEAVEGVAEHPEVLEVGQKPKKERKHLSKEEWEIAGRDPSKWKPKEQFDHDGSFFEKIESQSKYIKNLESKLKKLEERAVKQEKEEFEKRRVTIQSKRDQAILNGRLDEYYYAEEALRGLEEPEWEESPDETQQEVQKIDEDFVSRNKEWWNSDSMENIEMVDKASEYAEKLKPRLDRGEISLSKLVSLVEDQIRKEFPHRFEDSEDTTSEIDAIREELREVRKAVTAPPKVESNSLPRSKFSERDLPSSIRDIYVTAKREGYTTMSPKEYYQRYKESGGAD